jgi:hypothetical protein
LYCWEQVKQSYLIRRYVKEGDWHILAVMIVPSPPLLGKQADQYRVFAIEKLDQSQLQLIEESVRFPTRDVIPFGNMNSYIKYGGYQLRPAVDLAGFHLHKLFEGRSVMHKG